uniref:Uncharacterized protein n=1 Tax=Oryza punctata TaxID=4537 RepID=A0A0E0MC76_ORYPU
MEVQVKRSLVVPPPPRETEEVPLTVFDLVASTYHVTVLFAFSPPSRRRPFFVTGRGGAGALVVEAEFEHRGKEFLPHDGVGSRQGQDAGAVRVVDPSEVANLLLHYPSEFVAELKRRAQGKYTTFETVSAHVWKKITAVRGLDAGARTSVNVSVNGRARLGMATVPNSFFGNLIINASSGATARELTTGTLADAAALVRAGIRAVDRRYFQSFVDFGALHVDGVGGEEVPLEPANVDDPGVLSPDVDSDSWLHLELHRLDLGHGGRLAGILPAKVPEDGVVVVMPSLRKGGGVEVFVALWEKHANELTSIAYTMD